LKKIVILDAKTLGSVDLERFRAFGSLLVFQTTTVTEVLDRISEADIVITNKVVIGKNELSAAKNLKLVCVAATGVNNIDLIECKKRGVAVCNVVGYSTRSVAQITFSSILSFVSKSCYFDNFVKSGSYAKSDIFTDLSREFSEIAGKRFCVIGLGNIGKSIYKIAKNFGCKVCYYSTSGENSQKGYKRVSFEDMLECDIISIHCGLNEKTKNLFDSGALARIKKTAILANFGRGGIVCEKSVAGAIDDNRIGGYVTDVFEAEPMMSDSPLLSVKNQDRLLFTPHIAWASKEARERLAEKIANNIKRFLKGDTNGFIL